jgi:N-sulfoglucosamine sulfohydrolase
MTNILFISADDMSYNSTGVSGCCLENITPNIDWLANNGVFFKNAHTTVGLCQPSRSVWMTGLYPWNNGATGFNDIKKETTTLNEFILNKFLCKRYTTGIIGKSEHIGPFEKFNWEYRIQGYTDLVGWGKDNKAYYDFTKSFLQHVKEPFFLMVNSHFPHRPFAEKSRYKPCDVSVPGFLPDLFEIRKELANYYEGVHQCDICVGEIIKALKESGRYEDTLIIFTSDHGMAFPFVKANCYHYSTKVPLIWHFPKKFKPKMENNFVSGVDIMPTILDLIGIKINFYLFDGKSYLNLLTKKKEDFKKEIYTCLCQLWSGEYFQTRAIHNENYCYILNFWSDGDRQFSEDGSLDDQASCLAIKENFPEMYQKLRYRTPVEFYDLKVDPFAQKNISNGKKIEKQKMLNLLKKYAIDTKDNYTIKNLNIKLFS